MQELFGFFNGHSYHVQRPTTVWELSLENSQDSHPQVAPWWELSCVGPQNKLRLDPSCIDLHGWFQSKFPKLSKAACRQSTQFVWWSTDWTLWALRKGPTRDLQVGTASLGFRSVTAQLVWNMVQTSRNKIRYNAISLRKLRMIPNEDLSKFLAHPSAAASWILLIWLQSRWLAMFEHESLLHLNEIVHEL